MRNVDRLLAEYTASHMNSTNQLIHWICVPIIAWTVVALLWAAPFPAALRAGTVPLNWAVITLVLVQIYYFRLSLRLGLGALVFNLFLLWLTVVIDTAAPWPLWVVAAVVFVLAWIGQFIGHVIEGKRPSFFKDLQFLLIGPAWLMAKAFRRAGFQY